MKISQSVWLELRRSWEPKIKQYHKQLTLLRGLAIHTSITPKTDEELLAVLEVTLRDMDILISILERIPYIVREDIVEESEKEWIRND
jgi:hypothetical protein